ncbi:uncharacterized protein LOC143361914 [Halictus rubicundus]|uniref:uncharacterized protein LOC143361914 n=1 Tax=Halictus rubicundus TaxID=77578 RepID=UPI0040366087
MRLSLVLLVSLAASSLAAPVAPVGGRNSLSRSEDEVPVEAEIVTIRDATNRPAKKQSEKPDSGTKDSRSSLQSPIENKAEGKPDSSQVERRPGDNKDKVSKNRRHKAIFVNYPVVPQLPFPGVPYDDYARNNYNAEDTADAESKRRQESNIFYIRLPPTPYMFVPGLGYISQPPKYSTSNLRPQIGHHKPTRPKPVYQKPGNPFIKLPIDFVSNGKPTSVYQWQKKQKKPADSPITNLDSLSTEFVSNGKPTSIYQWQTNLKPAKRPDDLVNNLDKGPYTFNGKPTSFFLLKPDGTTSARQQLQYPDYQQDNSYY